MTTDQEITSALLQIGARIDPLILFPNVSPEASDLTFNDPYAFAIAACLDRGTKSEIIWSIPYYLKRELYHLDPDRIDRMSLRELARLFSRLPKKPRYITAAPQTLKELTSIVVKECQGDAANLWIGKRSSWVQGKFESIHGVGSGIASMAVLLIEKAFDVHFPDRWRMDIKPDVHIMRVLSRLGVLKRKTESEAVKVARKLNPKFPGGLDGPLWVLGTHWCHAQRPACPDCPISTLCPRINVLPKS